MPPSNADLGAPAELMTSFAERTGITGEGPPRRYLWTDAFAVCNFLALGRTELALALVDQVHRILGSHGGLRIGKPLPERAPGEPIDERLEWDRDGQYFHYLTRWMHALDQVAGATGQQAYRQRARELAQVAQRAFTYTPPGGGRKRMYWKMSVDLTRPQVSSMGQHDPLDGFITCVQLGVADAAAELAAMIEPRALATADPLGIGGLLVDAYRVQQLAEQGAMPDPDDLLAVLVRSAEVGLRHWMETSDLRLPADRRLAFRELGLSIGLAAAERMRVDELAPFLPVGAAIRSFWLEPENRRADTWTDHQDINDVMLATSLQPDGYLVLQPGRR